MKSTIKKPLLTYMKSAALILLVAFTSCNVNKHSYSDGAKWIPTDFNPAKDVLLVEHYPMKEKWNASMAQFLGKRYTWKYEIVDKETILGSKGKYADRQIYQFAVMWINEESPSHSTFSGGGTTTSFSGSQYDMGGHFLDRYTVKEYPTTKKYNNYGWKGFVPFL